MAVDSPGRQASDRVIVFAGDIHGEWQRLNSYLHAVKRKLGPINAVFAVGDAQALRTAGERSLMRQGRHYVHTGDFPDVASGNIAMAAPVYFIGGNHEPWQVLDENGPGIWAPNVHYLGRSGVEDVAGLRVGFLSGIFSATVSTTGLQRETPKSRSYWNQLDIASLMTEGPVDVLLTHDWPDGIEPPMHKGVHFGPGNATLRRLAEHLRPSVMACGHQHVSHRGTLGSTSVVCLPSVEGGGGSVVPFRVDGRNGFHEMALPSAIVTVVR